MTDEEYLHFLTALARKHSRYPQPSPNQDIDVASTSRALESYAGISRLLKLARDSDDPVIIDRLVESLKDSPVKRATELMFRCVQRDDCPDACGSWTSA